MLTWAEDMLSPTALVRFNEMYSKLSSEGFNAEEKTTISNIRGCEREIVALEQFLKKENESEAN